MIINKDKVIKGLTAIQDEAYDRWVHRPYIEDTLITLIRDNISDALSLLKEQEPVLLENQHKPYGISTNVNSPWISRCPRCGKKVEGKQTRFCKYCGKAVKWNK